MYIGKNTHRLFVHVFASVYVWFEKTGKWDFETSFIKHSCWTNYVILHMWFFLWTGRNFQILGPKSRQNCKENDISWSLPNRFCRKSSYPSILRYPIIWSLIRQTGWPCTWKNLKNRLGHEKSWKTYKNTWKKTEKSWKTEAKIIIISK